MTDYSNHPAIYDLKNLEKKRKKFLEAIEDLSTDAWYFLSRYHPSFFALLMNDIIAECKSRHYLLTNDLKLKLLDEVDN
jgi:hypothetical protein